jgi:hypothetical protein
MLICEFKDCREALNLREVLAGRLVAGPEVFQKFLARDADKDYR